VEDLIFSARRKMGKALGIGVPQKRWMLVENPSMDDLEVGNRYFWNLPK